MRVVARLRWAWPDVEIRVRGDNGVAAPALLDYRETAGLGYAFGYAANPVLQRKSEHWLREVELVHRLYGESDPHLQRYEEIPDYQAQSWERPRRVVAKVEVTPQGNQRRFVVTNLPQPPREVYRDFYVKRGAAPEQPIGQLKNGPRADRLSSYRFRANGLKLLVAVAYALTALYREACVRVEEVAKADLPTPRQRYGKVPAEVYQEAKAVRVSLPLDWEDGPVWEQTLQAVGRHAAESRQVGEPPGASGQAT